MGAALTLDAKVGGRGAENATEDAAHGVGAAKTAGSGDLIDGVGALLEPSGCGLHANALDEPGRRRAGLPQKDAGEVARAHGAAARERNNRQVVPQVIGNPRLKVAQ